MPSHDKQASYKAIRAGKQQTQNYAGWYSHMSGMAGGIASKLFGIDEPALIKRTDVILALPGKYAETYKGFMDLYDTTVDNCWPEDPEDTEEFIQLCCFLDLIEDVAELNVKAQNAMTVAANERAQANAERHTVILLEGKIQELRGRLIRELDNKADKKNLRESEEREIRRHFTQVNDAAFEISNIPVSVDDMIDAIATGQASMYGIGLAKIQDMLRQIQNSQGPMPPNLVQPVSNPASFWKNKNKGTHGKKKP
ncbi:MAG TPA: hypothetical protein VGF75_07245 [Candidatus Saccharimonadales bacterium]|jgi:hypothetical protein